MSNLTNDVAALQSAVVDNLISLITESVNLNWFFGFHVVNRLEIDFGYIYNSSNGIDYNQCIW